MIALMKPRITIASLHIYPVKSGRVIDCVEARIGPRGLQHDRHWMLIDAAGQFLTQRTHPQLAQLAASIDAECLCLEHPSCGKLTLALPSDFPSPQGHTKNVTIWRRTHAALDAGDEAADYCTKLIGSYARLVSAIDQNFPDGYPLLVCNAASLADLNQRMQAALPMSRFRPNIVLTGLNPWDEDRINTLQIGSVRLQFVKPCTRCVITSLDQASGMPDVNPLPTLREFRWNPKLQGVTFGENANVLSGTGTSLRVGDAVEIAWR